jgi:hypothetical protein
MTMQFDDGAHINDVALAVKSAVHATLLPDGGKLGNKELCRIVTMVLARFTVENPDVVCSPTSMSRAHDAAARTLRGAINDMKALGKLYPVRAADTIRLDEAH